MCICVYMCVYVHMHIHPCMWVAELVFANTGCKSSTMANLRYCINQGLPRRGGPMARNVIVVPQSGALGGASAHDLFELLCPQWGMQKKSVAKYAILKGTSLQTMA